MVTVNQLDTEVPTEVLEAAAAAAAAALQQCGFGNHALSLTFVDEDTIQDFNARYRAKDSVTDVLSFPLFESGQIPQDPAEAIGDVLVCWPRALAQAQEYGHSAVREAAFLAVHGTLHILGWDHDTKEHEAAMMDATEAVLREFGLGR